ncbi:MAG: hypothetical protein ABIJ34_06620 [archaeon]
MKKGLVFVILCLILTSIVYAPPSQRTVKGTVFQADGVTQAANGVYVFINNTNTSYTTTTQTSGPPNNEGRYSAAITADNNEIIFVLARNATNWGYSSGLMGNTQVDITVNLNRTRDSEARAEIIYPPNNTLWNSNQKVNVTANITILGNDGSFCNTTIIFSADGLSSKEPSTLDLGSIARGSSVIVTWNLTNYIDALTNITVLSKCRSDNIILEFLNTITHYNITNRDVNPPNLTIYYPYNSTRTNNPILFRYNVTDYSGVTNCTLTLNDVVVNRSDFPQAGNILNLTNNLIQKTNSWEINCTDNSTNNNKVTSSIYNLTWNSYPAITNIVLDSPINLLAGSNKTVYCNGSLVDGDSYLDISRINASLFLSSIDSGYPLNNSNHYKNSSCVIFNGVGNTADFRCGFAVEYYAGNGTWMCNASVIDYINSTNSSIVQGIVNELLAIGVAPGLINYGVMDLLQISPDDIKLNITNYGNVMLDLDLYSYSSFVDDNISMGCTRGNISFEYERFSVISGLGFNAMLPVNNSQTPAFGDLNLARRQGGDVLDSVKSLFWKLQIPWGADGTCSGKILVTAKKS